MAIKTKDANLSDIFTNHSIKLKVISHSKSDTSFDTIKHRPETSLKQYSLHLSESKIHEMANA